MIKSAIFESNPRHENIPGADLINDSMDAFWSVHRHAQFKPAQADPKARLPLEQECYKLNRA